jgi:hypothetical protein
MLWDAEKEQLLTEKIESEKRWFNSPAGALAQKKLEKVCGCGRAHACATPPPSSPGAPGVPAMAGVFGLTARRRVSRGPFAPCRTAGRPAWLACVCAYACVCVQHVMDVVEIVDQPGEDDTRAQVEMNLPWRLEYSWEDLIRVWRNTRTGEVIGPSLDSRVTPMTAKVPLAFVCAVVCVCVPFRCTSFAACPALGALSRDAVLLIASFVVALAFGACGLCCFARM